MGGRASLGMGRVLSTPAKLAWALPRPCLRSCCPFAAVAPALCCCAGAHVACLCFFCCPIFVCVSGPEMWVSWGMVTANSRPRGRSPWDLGGKPENLQVRLVPPPCSPALPPAPALARAGVAAILRGWHLRSYVDGIPGCLDARGWLTFRMLAPY